MVAKSRSVFICQQCGNESYKWFGRCPSCGEFESLVEVSKTLKEAKLGTAMPAGRQGNWKLGSKPVRLSEISVKELKRKSTGFKELDRVLGGGLVQGQVVLLAGEPGIGKSTLLLQVAAQLGSGKWEVGSGKWDIEVGSGIDEKEIKKSRNQEIKTSHFRNQKHLTSHFSPQILYVSGEESPNQIKLRAERLGIERENILLYPEVNVENVVVQLAQQLDQGRPLHLVIVDSVQSLYSDELTGIPSSIGQVRLCSQKLINICKSSAIPLFLVGQVTKEGTIAGPKVLEHVVDTVLYLEGERMEELRLLRCFKNRFGAVDELAVFRMEENGLQEVADASRLFSSEEGIGQPGAVLCPVVAGLRVLLVEVQSLAVATQLVNPRRISQGFSRSRLEMITAILQKHLKLPLYRFDIYVNVSGGLSIDDPAADLAVALSIYSSIKNQALPQNSCAFGELTLLSVVRSVLQKKKRVEEAIRLGLKHIYSSETSKYLPELVKKIFSN